MQSLIPNPKADYRSIADAFHKIVRYEGVKNTVRGVSAVVGGAGPAHALYFACYEKLKKVISGGHQGNHFAHGIFWSSILLFNKKHLTVRVKNSATCTMYQLIH